MSENPCITIKDIENNIQEGWVWNRIVCNPNIPLEYSIKYMKENNIRIEWRRVSQNPNITLEFIEQNIDNIDFEELSSNEFLWDNTVYKNCIKEDIQKRKFHVNNEIKNIFYNDICGEILKFVSYD